MVRKQMFEIKFPISYFPEKQIRTCVHTLIFTLTSKHSCRLAFSNKHIALLPCTEICCFSGHKSLATVQTSLQTMMLQYAVSHVALPWVKQIVAHATCCACICLLAYTQQIQQIQIYERLCQMDFGCFTFPLHFTMQGANQTQIRARQCLFARLLAKVANPR